MGGFFRWPIRWGELVRVGSSSACEPVMINPCYPLEYYDLLWPWDLIPSHILYWIDPDKLYMYVAICISGTGAPAGIEPDTKLMKAPLHERWFFMALHHQLIQRLPVLPGPCMPGMLPIIRLPGCSSHGSFPTLHTIYNHCILFHTWQNMVFRQTRKPSHPCLRLGYIQVSPKDQSI